MMMTKTKTTIINEEVRKKYEINVVRLDNVEQTMWEKSTN